MVTKSKMIQNHQKKKDCDAPSNPRNIGEAMQLNKSKKRFTDIK